MANPNAEASTSADTSKCTHCGKSARYNCKRCREGFNATGSVELTYYCGQTCQKAHWLSHKPERKLKLIRMCLWRAGDLLRDMAHIHARATWRHHSTVTPQDDGSLRMVGSGTLEQRLNENYVKFPFDDRPPKDRAALLAMAVEDCFRGELIGLAAGALEGIATSIEEVEVRLKMSSRVLMCASESDTAVDRKKVRNEGQTICRVTLSDGSLFALCPSLAEFGIEETVMPWSDFIERYFQSVGDISDLGDYSCHIRKSLPDMLVLANADEALCPYRRAWIINVYQYATVQVALKTALQAGPETLLTLRGILETSSEDYVALREILIRSFTTYLEFQVEMSRRQGGVSTMVADAVTRLPAMFAALGLPSLSD